MWLSQVDKWFTKHQPSQSRNAMDSNLTQPLATLPTPERAVLYKRLVDEHHAGVPKFKSVAAFHAAYLEQGGTPRNKSVGKDRLFAGAKMHRKLNRRSKKQHEAMAKAAYEGRSRECDQHAQTGLTPSESKNNRHGMNGQSSLAANMLNLNRSYSATDYGTLKGGIGGRSKGGRNYVKVENPYPNGRGHSSGVPKPLPPWDTPEYRQAQCEAFSQRNPGLIMTMEGCIYAAPRVESAF